MADVPEALRAALADRYRMDRELGRGGMAAVYLAEDLKHRRPVAVKVLHPEITALLGPERFTGRVEESEALIAQIKDPRRRQILEAQSAVSTADWALAESLGVTLQGDATANLWHRSLGAIAAACAAAARGSVGTAEARLRQAQQTAVAAKEDMEGEWPWREHVALAVFSGRDAPPVFPALARDTSAWAHWPRGMRAAAAGDTLDARRELVGLRRLAEQEPWALVPATMIEGWIALKGGRWSEARAILAPACPRGDRPVGGEAEGMRVLCRWLAADAYEALGRPDSAAAALELTFSPKRRYDAPTGPRGLCYSFAHRRLVMLYARAGRPTEARRHWDVLAETVTRPDPDVAARMDEARTALASAEAMARSRAR